MNLSAKERRALKTSASLSKANELVKQRLNRRIAQLGISPSQFSVLEALYLSGSLNQRQLGEKISKSSGNMTLVINNLVKRKLVERERMEKDRRHIQISLSPQGQTLIEAAFPKHIKTLVKACSVLSKTEQKELSRLCQKLSRKLKIR